MQETDMTGKQVSATTYYCFCSDSECLPCVFTAHTSQELQQQGQEELCSLEQALSENPQVPHVPSHMWGDWLYAWVL